ncbi:pentapeptide repeat-containing protein [Thalassobaculum sp.]|uniref:pentapeptide repeat-containing protein n=1 Tax=Thalassobaculum sp. TaxID=2022740 RepID=UPI0032ECE2C7
MTLTSWISFVVAPVVLLLAFQIRFLPYHDEMMTWTHRGLVLADLAIVWALWPLVLHPSGRIRTLLVDVLVMPFMGAYSQVLHLVETGQAFAKRAVHGPDRWSAILSMWKVQREIQRGAENMIRAVTASLVLLVASLFISLFSVCVAAIPDERVEKLLIEYLADSERWASREVGKVLPVVEVRGRLMLEWTAVLFDGTTDPIERRPLTWFSRNLVVVGETISRDGKIHFRGRDLRYAVLDRSEFNNVDFTGAQLDGASFREAQLIGAIFHDATAVNTDFVGAQLTGSSFHARDFWDTPPLYNLSNKKAFDGSGATFRQAKLIGANFTNATLDFASFDDADLRGAHLRGASLFGATFVGTDGRGALFTNAQAIGVMFDRAKLLAADFDDANVMASSFKSSDLRGSSFRQAEASGGLFLDCNLDAADLDGSTLWRTDGRPASNNLVRLGSPLTDPSPRVQPPNLDQIAAKLRAQGSAYSDSRSSIFERLERLKGDSTPIDGLHDRPLVEILVQSGYDPASDDSDLVWWWRYPRQILVVLGVLPPTKRPTRRADLLGELACSPDHAPHVSERVAERVLRNAALNRTTHLIERLLSPACEGSAALSDQLRRPLSSIMGARIADLSRE